MYQIKMRNTSKDYYVFEVFSEKKLDVNLAKKVVCEAWEFDDYPLECTEPVSNGSTFNFEYNGHVYELSCNAMQIMKAEPKRKISVPSTYKLILLSLIGCVIGSFTMLLLTHNRIFTLSGLLFVIIFITTFFINKLKANKNNAK